MRAVYRVQQFLAALSVRGPVDESALQPHLSTVQIALFQTMPVTEQRHALAVLRTLEEQGHLAPPLAQAALLHDVGKVVAPAARGRRSQGIALWHRVAAVLLEAVEPALLERVGRDEPDSWRFPFYVLAHHAERGAEMAAAAGTDPLAVALIRWHHTWDEQGTLDSHGQALLKALRAADEQN